MVSNIVNHELGAAGCSGHDLEGASDHQKGGMHTTLKWNGFEQPVIEKQQREWPWFLVNMSLLLPTQASAAHGTRTF